MMTPRERFNAVMDFQKPDKIPWAEFIWPDPYLDWLGTHIDAKKITKTTPGCSNFPLFINLTWPLYISDIDVHSYFGCINMFSSADPVDKGPIPRFPIKLIADTETYMEWIADTGAHIRLSKRNPYPWYSMPMYRNWPVKDRESWDEYKKRFNPMDPRRYPKDWDEDAYREKFKNYSAGPTRVAFDALYGFGAQLMGIDRFNKMFYKDPDLVHDIAEFWEFFTTESLRPFLDACGKYVDLAFWWEDMAERHGPFISRKLYEKFFLPHYKNVTRFLRRRGVKHIMLDSDGNLYPLLDLFIEAGIDGLWPLEVNANMDVAEIREKYGKKLWLSGNLDKAVVAQGGERMRREVDKAVARAKELGGYIPGCDHNIHAEFTYERFKEYADYMKEKL